MKPEIKFGLITGAGVCLWIMAEYLLGFHTTRPDIGEYSGYFSGLVPLGTLFLLLKHKREVAAEGRLALGQGIQAGLIASGIAAVLVYGFLVAYQLFINPGWLDNALEWKVAQMRARAQPEIDIRKAITFFRLAHSHTGLIATTFVGLPLLGAIYSLGLTLVLRRWPRPAPVS